MQLKNFKKFFFFKFLLLNVQSQLEHVLKHSFEWTELIVKITQNALKLIIPPTQKWSRVSMKQVTKTNCWCFVTEDLQSTNLLCSEESAEEENSITVTKQWN